MWVSLNNFKKTIRFNSLVSHANFLVTTKKKPHLKFSTILLPQHRIMATTNNSSENKQLFEKSDKIAHFRQDGKKKISCSIIK